MKQNITKLNKLKNGTKLLTEGRNKRTEDKFV